MRLRGWAFRVVAWLEGSLLAATTLTVQVGVFGATYGALSPEKTDELLWVIAIFVGLYSIPAFMLGLGTVGALAWWLMHRLGRTSPLAAVLASGVGCAAVGAGILLAIGAIQAMPAALFLVLPGAVAGWVIQRVAYDSPKPPRPSPARPS